MFSTIEEYTNRIQSNSLCQLGVDSLPYLLFFSLCGDSQVVKGERLKSVSRRSSRVRLPFPASGQRVRLPGNFNSLNR